MGASCGATVSFCELREPTEEISLKLLSVKRVLQEGDPGTLSVCTTLWIFKGSKIFLNPLFIPQSIRSFFVFSGVFRARLLDDWVLPPLAG